MRSNQAQADNKGVQAPPTVAVTKGNVVQSVDAPSQLVSMQEVNLQIGVSGTLQSVAVKPGDSVKQGQVLATIGDVEKYEGAVAGAQLQLLQAQQALDELIANAPQVTAQAQLNLLTAQQNLTKAQNAATALKYPRATDERIQDLENQYQADLEQVALAQKNFDRVSNKHTDDPQRVSALQALTAAQTQRDHDLGILNFVSGKPTQTDIDQTNANLAQAQAAYNLAQQAYDTVKDGPDPMKLKTDQATLAVANSQLTQAQDDLAHLELKAPFDGVVVQVNAHPREDVTPSTPIVDLYAPNSIEVMGTVTEEDYPIVNPGLKATLYFDSQPNLEITGTVERIVPYRQSGSQTQALYPLYIKMDQIPAGLAPGMTVDAQIVIAEKDNVLVLPRALVRARADGTATVQVWMNDHNENREIKVGLRGDTNIEIVTGLKQGDLVVSQ
jgi:RND family efflux transporter MFP subunit